MAKNIQTVVEGLNKALGSIKKDKDAKAKGFEAGIVEAAYFIFRQSLILVPVDKGLLRASGQVRQDGHNFDTVMYIEYTAAYAIWVHERLDLAHGAVYNRKYAEDIAAGRKTARGPKQQAKFIETPVRMYHDRIIYIVRERTIKG
jgi:hypothetical protein